MTKKLLYKKFNEFNYSGVYIIICRDSGKKYIGSSVNISARLKAHYLLLQNKKHSNKYLLNCFYKYGINGFDFDCLEQCPTIDLLKIEQKYLDQFKPELNIAKSTESVMLGRKHSQSTLDKFKDRKVWNKGISRTEEEKLLMSKRKIESYKNKDDNYKNWFSEVHKKNPSMYWLGKNLSEKSKIKLREANRKRFQRILCLNNNEIYECQNDAAKALNIKQGHISEVLNGNRKSASGYTFVRIKDAA